MPKAPAPKKARPESSPGPMRKKRNILHDESKGCRVTKAGRMQCEGNTSKGKRCLSFELTLGARFCSTHALERETAENESAMYATSHGKKQCEGITKSSDKQCLSFEEQLGARFCKTHAYQDASQRLGRICCGHSQFNVPCSNYVPFPDSGPVRPPFCGQHILQSDSVRVERCQWSDEDRECCVRYIPISSDRYFCKEHMMHASSPKYQQRPITNVSDDILLAIMKYLKPEERVAFALASRACATLVKGWGERDLPVVWSSAVALEPVVISRAATASNFHLAVVPDATDWDVFVTRKGSVLSVPFFSTFSVASLAAIDAEYRRCTKLSRKCWDCMVPIGRNGKSQLGSNRLAMALHKISDDDVYAAVTNFPFLFQSIKPACCMVCSGDLQGWPVYHTCTNCRMRQKDILVRWCLVCHGHLGALRIARVFWQAQKSLSAPSRQSPAQSTRITFQSTS